MFTDRGVDFDQPALLQLLNMHGDGAIAQIKPFGDFVQIQFLVGCEHFKNLYANLRTERFKDVDSAH
ncbi:hypothetical protein D3C71_2143270 [compost metagenome]